MQAILTSIVAVAGTLLGACLTYFLQRQIAREISLGERREQRRQDLLKAIDVYQSAVNKLRRSEHDRAKKRLTNAAPELREAARQDTYRLRSDAQSAYYRLRLRADPVADDDLLREAERIIELTRDIAAYTATETEMEERSAEARDELAAFVTAARQRFAETYAS